MTTIKELALRAALAVGTDQEDATFAAVRAAFEANGTHEYWSQVYARTAVRDVRPSVVAATRAEIDFQTANAVVPRDARTWALLDAANAALQALSIDEVRLIIAVTAVR